jgi:NADPH-dependent F420 reductase
LRIAVVGGTGDVGRGLSLRWSRYHDVVIGSREETKAFKVSVELVEKARRNYGESMEGKIEGAENTESVRGADVVVLTIPHSSIGPIMTSINHSLHGGQLVISPVVPMEKVGSTFRYRPFQGSGEHKSAAEVILSMIPEGVDFASAFHTVPARRLQNLGETIDADVVVSTDSRRVFEKVAQLVRLVPNLRPLYGGKIDMSAQIESITPLLLNLHSNSKMAGKAELTVKFV